MHVLEFRVFSDDDLPDVAAKLHQLVVDTRNLYSGDTVPLIETIGRKATPAEEDHANLIRRPKPIVSWGGVLTHVDKSTPPAMPEEELTVEDILRRCIELLSPLNEDAMKRVKLSKQTVVILDSNGFIWVKNALLSFLDQLEKEGTDGNENDNART